MDARASHTTKSGKAKCLAYRDGKRCGRLAKAEVRTRDRIGYGHQPVCTECAAAMMADGRAANIIQENTRGFTVHNASGFSGMVARGYRAIK